MALEPTAREGRQVRARFHLAFHFFPSTAGELIIDTPVRMPPACPARRPAPDAARPPPRRPRAGERHE